MVKCNPRSLNGNFLTRCGLHENYVMSRKFKSTGILLCNVFEGRGRPKTRNLWALACQFPIPCTSFEHISCVSIVGWGFRSASAFGPACSHSMSSTSTSTLRLLCPLLRSYGSFSGNVFGNFGPTTWALFMIRSLKSPFAVRNGNPNRHRFAAI